MKSFVAMLCVLLCSAAAQAQCTGGVCQRAAPVRQVVKAATAPVRYVRTQQPVRRFLLRSRQRCWR